MPWNRESDEEYDDGYTRESFERVDEDGPDDGDPPACECDNTHQTNDTVCRWCWSRGRRRWNDQEVN